MSDSVTPEETIFHGARQLPHGQDRAAYLDKACGSNTQLRAQVEHLLEAERRADQFLVTHPSPLKENFMKQMEMPAANREPQPGAVLEDYEIIEKIGGNMGLVFKARQRLLNKVVAVKLLPTEYITDPMRLARFQRELRVMAQLEHPNLVRVMDARVVGCWHLVAMEWIDGMDLQKVVDIQGGLPIPATCEAMRQAAQALEYAHGHGLIHRDIKPSNIMMTQAGVIKVIDLGLALAKEETISRKTESGMMLGTMRYCAPEQFEDASGVDIRADIYSLGCTMYHLLAGKPPYSHRTTLHELMQAHLQEPPPDLREARPEAPEGLETVIARMTAKDPAARYATPAHVAKALRSFARGGDTRHLLPSTSQRSTTKTRTVATAELVPAVAGQPAPAPRRPGSGGRKRKRPLGRMIAALLVVLALLGGIFLLMNHQDRQRERARAQEQERAQQTQRAQAAEPNAPRPDPIVFLMDTTAERGVYDPENKIKDGGNNAQVLDEVLRDLLPRSLQQEPVGWGWAREDYVLGKKPDLVIIHRSLFFHPLNSKIGLGYPPEANQETWDNLYASSDHYLGLVLGYIGTEPRTKFLVYSRGTDKNWLDPDFRKRWVQKLESRFPHLKDRIWTMEVPGLQKGTFKDRKTADQIRNLVREILGLPGKRD